MKKENDEKEKGLILEVTERESGLEVSFGTRGFNQLEVLGILQMQINQILAGMNEAPKVFKGMGNSNQTQA
jgi:hypothetical protein